MKKQEKCISCNRIFWAKAVKNKVTREVEAQDNICQSCKNRIRHKENLEHLVEINKPQKLRVIPEQFEKFIKMRELQEAEMKRRNEEKTKSQ